MRTHLPPRILAGFVVAVALTTGVAIAALRWADVRTRDLTGVTHAFDVTDHLERLTSALKDTEDGERAFVLTGEPRFLQPYQNAINAIGPILQELRLLTSDDPAQARRLARLDPLVRRRLTMLEGAIRLRQAGQSARSIDAFAGDGERLMGEIGSLADEMRGQEHDAIALRQQTWERREAIARLAIWFGAGMLVVLIVVAAIAVRADLARRQRLLDSFRRERERLDQSLRWLPVGTLVIDARSGRLLFANAEAERILGHRLPSGTSLLDPGLLEVRTPEGNPMPAQDMPISRAMRGEVVNGAEVTIRTTHAPPRAALVSATPIRDARGEVERVVVGFVDISRRKEAEEFQRKVAGIVGHDLRNPLNAILLSAHMLLQREDLDEKATRSVRRIASSSERMGRMIAQLLDFTRAQLAGGIPIERQRVDLPEVVRQVVSEIEVTHPGRIALHTTAPHIGGFWDPERLAQVVSNLVSNGIQHGEGTISVTLGLEADRAFVRVHNQNRRGPIPPEVLAHIFQPFRRGMHGQTNDGLGLGLYIAYEIARAHGGTLDVRSEPDGTTFTFKVPLAPEQPRAEEIRPEGAAVH